MLDKRLNLFPTDYPASAIVLRGSPANAHDVMIDGQFRKRDYRLVHESLRAMLDTLSASRARMHP